MENRMDFPAICIVGRPNVGKSSLFNELLGQRRAVVVEQAGTTRDRVEAVIPFGKYRIKLIDTGGYLAKDQDILACDIREQLLRGIEEADLLLLVCDSISGLTPQDKEIAKLVRSSGKPVEIVANKTDNEKLENDAAEFFSLGFERVSVVSCLHRRGIRSLRDVLVKKLDELGAVPREDIERPVFVAIAGRPNVGKSSLVNRMLSEERVIVSETPGTTRDSVDTWVLLNGRQYVLIDTAGIRHKRKVKKAVDVYSMMRAEESVGRADVVLILLDAAEGMTRDDIRVLKRCEQEGKPTVMVVNKWDLSSLAQGLTEEGYRDGLLDAYPPLQKYPLAFISAKTGYGIGGCMDLVSVLDADVDLMHSTSFLNKIFDRNDPSKVPVSRKSARPNFMYIVQVSSRPVEFKYFVNYPSRVRPAHLNFIENRLRENLPLRGIPIKIHIARSRKEEQC